jgi:predicted ATPase
MGDNKSTTIISLYGGPGAGKSTSAAYLYYLLKAAGENTEMVREYVKNWAWEGRMISAYDQIYFLGKQARHESMLFGKVKFIVTDAPIFMSVYYAQAFCTPILAEGIKQTVQAFYQQTLEDGHRHYHVLLQRAHKYASEGRYQTEDEAKEIDQKLDKMFADLKLPGLMKVNSDEKSLKALFDVIMREKT